MVAVLLLAAALAGCSGDGSDSAEAPGPSRSQSSGGSSEGTKSVAAQKLTEQYLRAPVTPVAVASVRGTVRSASGEDLPGTLDLLAVDAGSTSTAVRWKLSSDRPIEVVASTYYSRRDRSVADTTNVTLVAPSANLLLAAATWSGSAPASQDCTCARNPASLGPEGVELSSLFPALPSTVTEVQLRVPGFPPVSAPVRRS
jgi:hypothetical protein